MNEDTDTEAPKISPSAATCGSALLAALDRESLTMREARVILIEGICAYRKRRKQLRVKCDIFGLLANKGACRALKQALWALRRACYKKQNGPDQGRRASDSQKP